MNAAETSLPRWPFAPVLAGAGAGVLGAVAMLLLEVLSSTWQHRPWWIIPNLYATAVAGRRVMWEGPGWHTVAGIALQIAVLGLVGAAFGWLSRNWHDSRFLVGGALVFSILWFLFGQSVVWGGLSPVIPRQAPFLPTLLGHLLFGLTLGVSIRFLWPQPAPVPLPAPEPLVVAEVQGTEQHDAQQDDSR